MYVILIRTPNPDYPELGGEIKRVEYTTREAAEEAAKKELREGKDAVVLYPHLVYKVGPDGVVREIRRF